MVVVELGFTVVVVVELGVVALSVELGVLIVVVVMELGVLVESGVVVEV